jgi:PhoH-like ATPase
MPAEKIYLLDTNVLVYDPQSIFNFGHNTIAIPITVLEELDRFKSESTERGAMTRKAIRSLDALRDRGSLQEGVKLDTGGKLQVIFMPEAHQRIPLTLNIADNVILMTALNLKSKGHEVHFISKDLNARVKADALGIETEDYIKEFLAKDTIYKGWIHEEVPAIQFKKDVPDILNELMKDGVLIPNQFVLLTSRNNPMNYRMFRYRNKAFRPVKNASLRWPLEARNPQQAMALDLLFDPEISLVSLIGPAGTGKTFLALLAGLHQVLLQELYRKMLISRPVIPLGPDIGYLPGTVEEKLHSWMQPMYDNMEFIAYAANKSNHEHDYEQSYDRHHDRPAYVGGKDWRQNREKKKKRHNGDRDHHAKRGLPPLDQLSKDGKISIEAITYMRGRSIPYQFILLDEVQNLSPHEVKTLISRVGEGSKIIIAGDPFQIDTPFLDFSSNGLVVASSKFIGQDLFGTVFLENSERSELSKLASQLL